MIGGYGHLANWLALFYAVITRRCIVLWSGAGTESHKNKGCFYRFFKRLFVSKVHRFISYGSSAYRYLVSLGVQPEKIRKAVNVSDIDFFKSIPTSDSIVKAERVIREFLPHSKNVRILLFVGQMNRRKGVDVLVKELSLLEQHRYFCHFVGEGPLAQDVQRAITDGSISGFFWGKLTREHVRELMHNSDVYVLPTRFDPFSRTLSEAIASGCYCLNSVFDDATEDLLVEGVNGESFNPSVRGELFRCLCKVTQQDFLLPNKESIRATLRNSTEDYASCVINSVFDSMGVDI
jgi:glycosyltransferase involved in cell wall biosynthesis